MDSRDTVGVLQQLGQGIDWLVLDHYSIDVLWETRLRPFTAGIMVIDDLADRRHDCDLLLDQNLYSDQEQRYLGKVPGCCKLLLGPRYALLREEFRAGRRYPAMRTGSLSRVLVFFGGTDSENVTGKALDAIRSLRRVDIQVDVIISSNNPNREALEQQCRHMENVTCHFQVTNMSEFMEKADLALGGGGITTWERCAMSLPAVVVSLARNQQAIAEALAATGAITYLGPSAVVDAEDIRDALTQICSHPEKLQEQGRISGQLVDGCGAERVMAEMVNDI
jgi:UDP-2,4-diacetamido-2,4,6-trideoxy-beta-L-altropyranose hydrolase